MAIIDAINDNRDYNFYLKKYIKDYTDYKPNFNPYFKSSFSPNMIKWANGSYIGNSTGNGAMMRVSPIGYLFDKENDVIENAYLSTIPSHNSKEAIECSKIIALMIYYFRNGLSKEEVFKKLNIKIEYKPFDKFNTTCYETINNCLYVIYNSYSFEDAIRKIIYLGGDTDTNACIVGSVVESIYGIDDYLIEQANEKIPDCFVRELKMIYKK
jgi:ADP-ribosylglycohydrolase